MLRIVFSLTTLLIHQVWGFGVKEPLSSLLQKHVSEISRLKEETQAVIGSIDQAPYNNDVFYLRYCLEEKGIDELKENLAWRTGPGKDICAKASSAFEKASSERGKWDNAPVRDGAPNAEKINKYITPDSCLTTPSLEGDLIYCVRAGFIDDEALMSTVSSDDMVDFFLYCKEMNALVANDRSLEMDKLLYVITANDLSGLKLIGGDATFRQALSASSKQGSKLYPALGGPTLLLNLPRLVSALVKVFTPLFPAEVRARIKFERGPLANVEKLLEVSHGGKYRADFLEDIERLCYQN